MQHIHLNNHTVFRVTDHNLIDKVEMTPQFSDAPFIVEYYFTFNCCNFKNSKYNKLFWEEIVTFFKMLVNFFKMTP